MCNCNSAPAAEPILLCAGGNSVYQIVIADDATVYEKKAAKLLQLHLLKLADAYLPIVGESAPARDCELVVGCTGRSAACGLTVEPATCAGDLISNVDSYRILTVGERIFFLCMGDPANRPQNRGTVFAAYRFIEKIFGFDPVYDRACNDYKDMTLDRVTVPRDLDIEASSRTLSGRFVRDYPGETVMYMLPQADMSTTSGESVILKTAGGKILVIDGGYKGELENITEALRVLMPGQTPRVDAWLITHLHEDHFDALMHYVDCVNGGQDVGGLAVKEIWGHIMSDAWYERSGLGQYVERANRLKNPPAPTKYVELNTHDRITFDDAEIEVLFTCPEALKVNMNNSSVVVKVTARGKSILLLADMEWAAEAEMKRNITPDRLKADAVQIGHHGTFNVSKATYREIGAEVYFWPITYKMWYCDDGTGMAAINKRYGTFDEMSSTRRMLISLGVPPEKIFISYRGISVYHFGTGEAEFISRPGN